MDFNTHGAAYARPGMDTRQWVTFATVLKETGDAKVIRFEDGQPMVDVKLHPSGLQVPCRVAAGVAGNGEGEWFPFIEGDEVIVLVPQGSERAGCTIVGRLNNEIDAFPSRVAGQEVDGNNFAFRRLRTPYILETASSYLVRSATTEAFISMNPTGELTLSNSDKAFFTLSHDHLTIQSGDGDQLLQIDTKAKTVRLETRGTKFILDAEGDSLLATSGRMLISTSGRSPAGHLMTIEQFVVAMSVFLPAFGNLIGGGFGTAAAAAFAPGSPALDAAVAAASATGLFPGTIAAIRTALAFEPTDVKPGFGIAGLLAG